MENLDNSNCCDAPIINGICSDCKEHCISIGEEMAQLERKAIFKEIEKKMIEKEEQGLIISKEVILEILKELTDISLN